MLLGNCWLTAGKSQARNDDANVNADDEEVEELGMLFPLLPFLPTTFPFSPSHSLTAPFLPHSFTLTHLSSSFYPHFMLLDEHQRLPSPLLSLLMFAVLSSLEQD
eukprot:768737-Hanusia_phi.AAC.9